MESQEKKAYKPRACKTPGGDAAIVPDESKQNQPITLREIQGKPIPAPVKWVLTNHGWEAQ